MTAPREPSITRDSPQAISELRAGHATLSAMLMNLFDELDHRRFELIEKSKAGRRGAAAHRGAPAADAQEAERQIAALERALASARGSMPSDWRSSP